MIILRLPAMLFLGLAVVAPVLYLRNSDFHTLQTKEGLMVFLAFAASATAGVCLLMLAGKGQSGTEETETDNQSQRTAPGSALPPRPNGFKKPTVNKKVIKHHLKPSTEADMLMAACEEKPDFDKLMDDFKNYLKLEAWGMALGKANEALHYYPDRPEVEKIRSNLSFLTQKVKSSV